MTWHVKLNGGPHDGERHAFHTDYTTDVIIMDGPNGVDDRYRATGTYDRDPRDGRMVEVFQWEVPKPGAPA